ncbi:MAG TPA: coenzyme F420-0:L-glutamate ligase [Candidatus Woesebacteria bacterium]|nr:coenzyme F420-0:L-glutamate ligase [Candidatus Woesebacteria bacterium]
MTITPIKSRYVQPNDNLQDVILSAVSEIPERSVLAVTSKIVALCEGRVVLKKSGQRQEKHQLVAQEAEQYIDPVVSKYDLMLTIKYGVLSVNAGVDESNVDQKYYVLLPENPWGSAVKIWQFCRQHFGVKELGVIITDSKTTPLKWGVTGTCLGYCGFEGLKNLIGNKDLAGRALTMTKVNVAEALAASAVYVMGEADESQPFALITDLPDTKFAQKPPSNKEIAAQLIKPEDDAYWPILSQAKWKKHI